MEAQKLRFSEDYSEHFNPKCYLEMFYRTPEGHIEEGECTLKILTNLHDFWSSRESNNLTMLEFGGGPCIYTLISACPNVKEIVFSEFAAPNRKEVEIWRERQSSAHDWSSFFEHVVQTLEGKTKEEAKKREEELRKKITHIVPCDIRATSPIQLPECSAIELLLFDVVNTTLCLESVAESEAAYRQAIVKLSKLVKPGGHLVMSGVLNDTFYKVGNETFHCFPLSKSLVLQALQEAGFQDVKLIAGDCLNNEGIVSNFDGVFFAYGKLASG